MKKIVTVASCLGLFVPLFWGIAGLFLFNLKESLASEVFWAAVYISCPFWALPGLWGSVAMPLLNAFLYGSIAFVVYARLPGSS